MNECVMSDEYVRTVEVVGQNLRQGDDYSMLKTSTFDRNNN